MNRAAFSLFSSNKSPERERKTRRQPSIPQTASEIRQPRQKVQLHRPLRRSRSIPRETMENIRRRVRDFGETSFSAGSARVSSQTNRHSFDALLVEDNIKDVHPQDERCDALPTATANAASSRRLLTRASESKEMQVKRFVISREVCM